MHMAQPSKKKVTAKPAVKVKAKMAAKPKVTKSRGSNTKKQVGDQNQREWYNGIRQKAGGKIVNTSTDANGQLLKVAQKDKDGRVRASSQRAGGKGK
jgi:starvation-inducible outer membrane lipoprotein